MVMCEDKDGIFIDLIDRGPPVVDTRILALTTVCRQIHCETKETVNEITITLCTCFLDDFTDCPEAFNDDQVKRVLDLERLARKPRAREALLNAPRVVADLGSTTVEPKDSLDDIKSFLSQIIDPLYGLLGRESAVSPLLGSVEVTMTIEFRTTNTFDKEATALRYCFPYGIDGSTIRQALQCCLENATGLTAYKGKSLRRRIRSVHRLVAEGVLAELRLVRMPRSYVTVVPTGRHIEISRWQETS
jgi:hypothetical protein